MKMIFEKLDYQQDCINNILQLLESFDFKALKSSANSHNDEIILGGGGE